MSFRIKTFLIAVAGFLAFWLGGPLFVRNYEAFMERRGWDQIANTLWDRLASALPEVIGVASYLPTGFWAGVFMTLAVWGVAEVIHALRRKPTIPVDDQPQHMKIHLQQTYAGTGLLDHFATSIEFFENAKNVSICLDFRGRTQDQSEMGAWTRLTLLSKERVAKGEYLHKQIFSMRQDQRERTLVIESPNDFDGRKRTLPYGFIMEGVVIVFYEIDGVHFNRRKPFLAMSPVFSVRAWPEITTDVALGYRGMD